MVQPVNVATPLTAVALEHPDSVPLPGLFPMARVTVLWSDVTRCPWESSIHTVGWLAEIHGVPPVPPPGCVWKTSWAGTPLVMLKGPLVTAASPSVGSEAVSV